MPVHYVEQLLDAVITARLNCDSGWYKSDRQPPLGCL